MEDKEKAERTEKIEAVVGAIVDVIENLILDKTDSYYGGQTYEARKVLAEKLTALFEK